MVALLILAIGAINYVNLATVPADIEKIPRPWLESRYTDLRSFRVAEHGGRDRAAREPGPPRASAEPAVTPPGGGRSPAGGTAAGAG